MNCIGALRRCSLTFAVLVRSCGLGLVVDCALIAHGADGGKGIGRFILDTSGGSIILNASIFTCSVLLSVGSTGRGQGPTSTQNNLGLLLGPNLSLGLLDCHLLAHNPLGAAASGSAKTAPAASTVDALSMSRLESLLS